MGTKSVGQVAGFKYRFLQKHPLWRRFDYGSPTVDSSPQYTSAETSSCHSSPSSIVTNKAPSPPTTEIDPSDCERFVESLTLPRSRSTLLNRADVLIAALRAPMPLHLTQPTGDGEQVGVPTEPDQGDGHHTFNNQHTPPTSWKPENRLSPQTPVDPVHERLRLDFTERDFAGNNAETTTPPPEPITTTTSILTHLQ